MYILPLLALSAAVMLPNQKRRERQSTVQLVVSARLLIRGALRPAHHPLTHGGQKVYVEERLYPVV